MPRGGVEEDDPFLEAHFTPVPQPLESGPAGGTFRTHEEPFMNGNLANGFLNLFVSYAQGAAPALSDVAQDQEIPQWLWDSNS